jgi:hypothetical protein
VEKSQAALPAVKTPASSMPPENSARHLWLTTLRSRPAWVQAGLEEGSQARSAQPSLAVSAASNAGRASCTPLSLAPAAQLAVLLMLRTAPSRRHMTPALRPVLLPKGSRAAAQDLVKTAARRSHRPLQHWRAHPATAARLGCTAARGGHRLPGTARKGGLAGFQRVYLDLVL